MRSDHLFSQIASAHNAKKHFWGTKKMNQPLRIALIGCGALGRIFALNTQQLLSEHYQICAVMARQFEHAQKLADEINTKPVHDLEELLAEKPEMVIELAGAQALHDYAETILSQGINLVAASVGALADSAFKNKLLCAAQKHHATLYIPNGAIGGLDLMRTFALMQGATLEIENIKAPKSLNGAPYLKGESLPNDRPITVFEGGVKEAIAGFPKNVNVAVAASLATEAISSHVTIKSDPGTNVNTHHLTLKNALMSADITISSKPDPRNPKSSTSTAWSVIALLQNLASPLRFF